MVERGSSELRPVSIIQGCFREGNKMFCHRLSASVSVASGFLLFLSSPAAAQQVGEQRNIAACSFSAETYIVDLQNEDAGRRWIAAECLGQMKEGRAVASLVQAVLSERFPRLKLIETDALLQIGDASAEDLFLAALDNDGTRTAAIYALGRLRSKKAVDSILARMSHADRFTLGTAMDALAEIKDERTLALLCSLLKHNDEVIRRGAAMNLGFLGELGAAQPLAAALKDQDDGVRENAAEALGRLKAANAIDALVLSLKDPDEGVRVNSLDALGNIGDIRAAEAVGRTFSSARGRTRWHAASALATFDIPQASTLLLNALQHGDLATVAAGYKFFLSRNDSEFVPVLSRAMREYGFYKMAEDFENSGDPQLRDAAQDWKSRRSLELTPVE